MSTESWSEQAACSGVGRRRMGGRGGSPEGLLCLKHTDVSTGEKTAGGMWHSRLE